MPDLYLGVVLQVACWLSFFFFSNLQTSYIDIRILSSVCVYKYTWQLSSVRERLDLFKEKDFYSWLTKQKQAAA